MKRLYLLTGLVVAIFVLAGCNLFGGDDSQSSIFNDKESLIGFSAFSSVMTLHNYQENTSLYQSDPIILENTTDDDTFAILSEIDALKPYLDLVSTFMGEGQNFDVGITDSSHEDYDQQMVITTVDMAGDSVSYTMYYNETYENGYEEGYDPEEYDSDIEGIMIIDGVTYTMIGARQVDEGEESLELIAKLDDENYVVLDYEIEIDSDQHSVEFDYEMFVNNQLEMSIELQFQEDEEETEISLKFIRGTREIEYDFELTTDGDERIIEIDYKITEGGSVIEEGEAEVKIVYNAEKGQYVVQYEIETTTGDKITVEVE